MILGLFLLLITVLLILEVMRVDSGRQGCGVAKSPGFGLIHTSIQIIKRMANIFIEPEFGARHGVKCLTYINS